VLGDDLNNIVGTSLDKGVELDALVKMAPSARREIIRRAKAGEKVSAHGEVEPKTKSVAADHVDFWLSPCTVKAIDEWRLREPDLPTPSGALERLVELGLEAAAKRKPKPGRAKEETLLALMTRVQQELEDRLEGSPAANRPRTWPISAER
jgi:hypothetical protein